MLAQGVPGSPTRAAFARVGVVKPWVDWEKLTSPFRDGTVLTFPLAAGTLIRGAAQGNSLLRLSLRSEEQDVQIANHRQRKGMMGPDTVSDEPLRQRNDYTLTMAVFNSLEPSPVNGPIPSMPSVKMVAETPCYSILVP